MIRDLRMLEIAAIMLPNTDPDALTLVTGEFHDVLLSPGHAVVKVARGSAVGHLPRRAKLLDLLAPHLPFETPRPISSVVTISDRAAVTLSWVSGGGEAPPVVTPSQVEGLLRAIATVPLGEVAELLDAPHAYAGRERWSHLMVEEVVPRLPLDVRDEALRRVNAALGLPEVEPVLVHGDLGGTNLRWSSGPTLAGVIDWDLAQPFDPAIDAACLATWFGWRTVQQAVSADTYHRARIWFDTFGLEQPAAAIDNGESQYVIEGQIQRAAEWVRKTE